MAMQFDRQRMMSNINLLIKEKGVKIGELESSIGVSAGYLSRMNRKDSETIPGTDVIWKIAKYLNVSVDALLNVDMAYRLSDNVIFMSNFIFNLEYRTENGMKWKAQTLDEFELVKKGLKYHELFEYTEKTDSEPNMIKALLIPAAVVAGMAYPIIAGTLLVAAGVALGIKENKELASESKAIYCFYKPAVRDLDEAATVSPAGTCYCLQMEKYRLYLMFLKTEDNSGQYYELLTAEDSFREYSLEDHTGVAGTEYCKIEVLCSSKENPELAEDLEKLYDCLGRMEQDLKISETARKRITSFLNDEAYIEQKGIDGSDLDWENEASGDAAYIDQEGEDGSDLDWEIEASGDTTYVDTEGEDGSDLDWGI